MHLTSKVRRLGLDVAVQEGSTLPLLPQRRRNDDVRRWQNLELVNTITPSFHGVMSGRINQSLFPITIPSCLPSVSS